MNKDFTTANFNDPGGDFTINPLTIDFDTFPRSTLGWIAFDEGPGALGDVIVDIDAVFTASDSGAIYLTLAMTNAEDVWQTIKNASGDLNGVMFAREVGAHGGWFIREIDAGDDSNFDSFNEASSITGVPRYLRMVKVGSDLSLFVYSDSGRTSLVDSVSITLTDSQTFRYLFPLMGLNDGNSPGDVITGTISNMVFGDELGFVPISDRIILESDTERRLLILGR